MIHFSLAAALLAAAPTTFAQDPAPTQADYKARYEEKLAKPFIQAGGWITDYDLARERAAKEKKFLFVYFTRSWAK